MGGIAKNPAIDTCQPEATKEFPSFEHVATDTGENAPPRARMPPPGNASIFLQSVFTQLLMPSKFTAPPGEADPGLTVMAVPSSGA